MSFAAIFKRIINLSFQHRRIFRTGGGNEIRRDIDIKIGVDYIVTFRQEEKEPGTPSTIVKWDKGQAIVVRD
jgi:hypothetical protein